MIMKYVFVIFLIFLSLHQSMAQSILIKDIDQDKIMDTIQYDFNTDMIVGKLSSLSYEPIHSLALVTLSDSVGVVDHKEGFEFFIQWQYSSAHVVFQYNKRRKRLVSVILQRRDKGELITSHHNGSSILEIPKNLYTGSWEYWDVDTKQLTAYPTIKEKLSYDKIDLDKFDINYLSGYLNDCRQILSKYAETFNLKKTKVKK